MKRPGWILLLIPLTGCAAHRAPKPAVPAPVPADWSAILAIPRGTFVFVAVDAADVRRGFVWEATDTALIVDETTGGRRLGRNAIVRGDVARVTARQLLEPKNRRRDLLIGVPTVSAFVGGLTGMVVGAVQKDRTLGRASARMFFGSLLASALSYPLSPKATIEDRVIYVRP